MRYERNALERHDIFRMEMRFIYRHTYSGEPLRHTPYASFSRLFIITLSFLRRRFIYSHFLPGIIFAILFTTWASRHDAIRHAITITLHHTNIFMLDIWWYTYAFRFLLELALRHAFQILFIFIFFDTTFSFTFTVICFLSLRLPLFIGFLTLLEYCYRRFIWRVRHCWV